MTTLIIQLPARQRQSSEAAAADASAAASAPKEYAYVLTANGQTVARQGGAAPSALPRAEHVVAVTAPTDVSWHRLELPKAPAARLRQALGALLEDELLDDPDDIHVAVAPGAKAGDSTWVAVCDHTWLTGHLMALEKAQIRVDRVVPGVWPDAPPTAYFHELHDTGHSPEERGLELMLTWSTPDGVATWPLQGSLARALLPEPLPPGSRFLATPATAAPAERWLGHVVQSQSPGEHLLQSARSMWNLLQFELTPRSKGWQVITDQWRQFRSPQWRPVRAGLLALVAVQVIGLNAWAWHQQREIKARKAEMTTLLSEAHPQIRVVLDPMVQMQRETESVRAMAGQLGGQDMEVYMQAVASAWVGEQPAKGLIYDGSSLVVGVPPEWSPSDLDQFGSRMRTAGFTVELGDGQLTLRRAPGAP